MALGAGICLMPAALGLTDGQDAAFGAHCHPQRFLPKGACDRPSLPISFHPLVAPFGAKPWFRNGDSVPAVLVRIAALAKRHVGCDCDDIGVDLERQWSLVVPGVCASCGVS